MEGSSHSIVDGRRKANHHSCKHTELSMHLYVSLACLSDPSKNIVTNPGSCSVSCRFAERATSHVWDVSMIRQEVSRSEVLLLRASMNQAVDSEQYLHSESPRASGPCVGIFAQGWRSASEWQSQDGLPFFRSHFLNLESQTIRNRTIPCIAPVSSASHIERRTPGGLRFE